MNELKPLDEKEVRDFLFSYLFKYPTIDTDAIIKLSIAISARFGTSAVGTGKQVECKHESHVRLGNRQWCSSCGAIAMILGNETLDWIFPVNSTAPR